jgi:hypothetical protein
MYSYVVLDHGYPKIKAKWSKVSLIATVRTVVVLAETGTGLTVELFFARRVGGNMQFQEVCSQSSDEVVVWNLISPTAWKRCIACMARTAYMD